MFARTPIPGQVKSRLLTHLTPDQACRLHLAATLDSVALLDKALAARTGVARWIFWSESPAPDFRSFRLPPSFRTAIQVGAGLGERMGEAFTRAFASGAARVVILGSDIPHLPSSRIPEAFHMLNDTDCVVGPSVDGGYYLIGCRRFDGELFRDVAWGSSQALEQTLANAVRLHYRTELLDPWYDLDEWSDVERLRQEARRGSTLPAHLAAFFDHLEKERGIQTEAD